MGYRPRRAAAWTGFLVAAAAVIVPVGPAAAADLIVNGSFEQPDIPRGGSGTGPGTLYLTAIDGWTHAPAPGSTLPFLEIQDHHMDYLPGAGLGDQYVELDAADSTFVFQDIPTQVGSTYHMTFAASPRPQQQPAENHFRVTAGPAEFEVGPMAAVPQTVWVGYSIDFVATSATSRIGFLDLGPSNSYGAFVDGVTVELVSTPTSLQALPVVGSSGALELRAVLTETGTGAPLPGRTIVMSTTNGPICQAVTGPDGTAACQGLSELLNIILDNGYTATFAGEAPLLPATARGGLLPGPTGLVPTPTTVLPAPTSSVLPVVATTTAPIGGGLAATGGDGTTRLWGLVLLVLALGCANGAAITRHRRVS